jgi:Fur family ferric uptake transcriptional regulator
MKLNPAQILKEHDLKHTKQRVRVLEEIVMDETAISQPDLEKKIGTEIDRVTLYRILNTYEDKGILHRIIDKNGTANYAICSSSCSAEDHHDEHVHFNCTNCSKIYCLNAMVPNVQMPKGFLASTINSIVYGICKNCNVLS